jgi:hypothetical protein
MSKRSSAATIRQVLADDALVRVEAAWAANPLPESAEIGYDDVRGEWWAACPACGIERHYSESYDVVECTRRGHNRRQHAA